MAALAIEQIYTGTNVGIYQVNTVLPVSNSLGVYYSIIGSGDNLHQRIEYQEVQQNTIGYIEDKYFIRIIKSFHDEWSEKEEYFEGLTLFRAKELIVQSLQFLLYCEPEVISLQLTSDGSAFYTLKKNGITIYFEHYLINHFDENDEVIITARKGDMTEFSFAGDFSNATSVMSKSLRKLGIKIPVFA